MFEKVSELQQQAVNKFFSSQTNGRLLVGFPVGVGKTVVALNVAKRVLEENNDSKILSVVPANLRNNFIENINKFQLNNIIKPIIIQSLDELKLLYKKFNFFIVSYHFIGSYYEKLLKYNFDLAIFDEAHYGKNNYTSFSEAMENICFNVNKVLLLTASFISNRVEEFGRMLFYLTKDRTFLTLKTVEDFKKYKEIIKAHTIILSEKHVEKLIQKPKPIYEIVKIPLDQYTENVYNLVENSESVTSVINKIKIGAWNTREVKNALMMLQQVLLVPDYIKHDYDPAKAEHVGSKVTYCIKQLKQTKGVKTIVFVPFVYAGALVIQRYLKSNGIDCEVYHGELKMEERLKLIDRYENGNLDVMILTMAGREGINLPSTKQIIFLGYSWNPEDITQIVGRATRVTSKNKFVYVYFYESVKKKFNIFNQKTIDGIMLEVIQRKKQLKVQVEDHFSKPV